MRAEIVLGGLEYDPGADGCLSARSDSALPRNDSLVRDVCPRLRCYTRVFGAQFFSEALSTRCTQYGAAVGLIEKSAHKQGGPFRRFVFTEPGRLLSLTDEALCAEMAQVAEARKQSLTDREADLSCSAVARGALIYFEPALSMYDGAAMMGSGGFFDVENFPPADTWIAYISKRISRKANSGFLLSWVPEELVDLADEGVRVEPSGSLQWADEESDEFVQEICRQLHFACALPAQ